MNQVGSWRSELVLGRGYFSLGSHCMNTRLIALHGITKLSCSHPIFLTFLLFTITRMNCLAILYGNKGCSMRHINVR
jgi:hypothetical protein